jgi:hypothetical protein
MASTYSDRLKFELQETGANASTWGTNTNNNLSLADTFGAGYQSISIAGSANVTLTTADADPSTQSSNKVVELTGTLTGNVYVFIPAVESNYTIFNNTAGSFTVNVAPTGHAANLVGIVQGGHTIVYNNADNKVVDIFGGTLGSPKILTNLTVSSTVMTAANGHITGASYTGNGSTLTNVSSIPSGTKAVFFQASAPSGWTQDTTAALNEAALRIVVGSGGGTGGSDTFGSVFSASKTSNTQTLTLGSGAVSVSLPAASAADTTISTPTLAAHTHTGFYGTNVPSGESNHPRAVSPVSAVTFDSSGGGGAHSHPVSGSVSLSGDATATDTTLTASNFSIKHANVIIAAKD